MTRPPAWAMRATAPLRRERPSRAWSAVRLAVVALAVVGVWAGVREVDPRPWVAVVVALVPAVVLSPAVLLAIEALRRR